MPIHAYIPHLSSTGRYMRIQQGLLWKETVTLIPKGEMKVSRNIIKPADFSYCPQENMDCIRFKEQWHVTACPEQLLTERNKKEILFPRQHEGHSNRKSSTQKTVAILNLETYEGLGAYLKLLHILSILFFI